MPTHHPDEDLLLAYAAGGLSSTSNLVIATHLTFCPACRKAVAACERVGGALMANMPADELPQDLLPQTLARLGRHTQVQNSLAQNSQQQKSTPASPWPAPLAQILAGRDVRWRRRLPGLEDFDLPIAHPFGTAKLLRIKAGAAMPHHTHEGRELTLVLQGGFHDRGQFYGVGDISCTNSDVQHHPTADEDADCICLAVTTGKLRLTGFIGTLLNPFVRY